jgi:hypothetical protein
VYGFAVSQRYNPQIAGLLVVFSHNLQPEANATVRLNLALKGCGDCLGTPLSVDIWPFPQDPVLRSSAWSSSRLTGCKALSAATSRLHVLASHRRIRRLKQKAARLGSGHRLAVEEPLNVFAA